MQIMRAGPERIADLEPLYTALHEHHVAVAPTLAGMEARTSEESWRGRRGKYERWLGTPGAFVLIAEQGGRPVGYALVSLSNGLQAWASGERLADLRDLAVLPEERGHGIGSALVDAVERELTAVGIRDYRVNVIAANTDAIRFYERHGMALVSHVLVGRTGT